MMTNRDRVWAVMQEQHRPLCDDCLSELSGVRPRQTVRAACLEMEAEGLVNRSRRACGECGRTKLASSPSTSDPTGAKARSVVSAEGTRRLMREETARPWFWEGNVQSVLADWLEQNCFRVIEVADTESRASGIDLVAHDQNGRELWVSVKGFPQKNGYTQARHWFAGALFDAVLYRSRRSDVDVAVAFPDGFITYRNLYQRVGWLVAEMPLTVFWVSSDGSVQVDRSSS